MSDLESKIEAVIFIYGEFISINRLADLLEVDEKEIRAAVLGIQEKFIADNRGLRLIIHDDKIQLITRPEYGPLIEKLIKEETRAELTPASLETLSIIAYLGPISRPAIDYIRGVNSSFTLRNLMIRGLIERTIDPKRANAYLYQISPDSLKYLGINSTKELPDFEKYRQLINIFKKENEESV